MTDDSYKEFLAPQDSFRFFIRKHEEEDGRVKLTNEDIDELHIDFAKYLSKVGFNEEQKKNVLPKSAIDIIMNKDHPLRRFGFPLGYSAHFYEFVDSVKKEWEEGEK